MNILIAPDKFKGSLTALAAARAIADGIRRCLPTANLRELPLADGGEGTAAILTQATGGTLLTGRVNDALMRPISATYGVSGDGKTAFIEMAEASGLQRLHPSDYDPMRASTFGTGELIRQALERGVSAIVLCIGGSATNDGGTGMASALGVRFFDQQNQAMRPNGGNLVHIRRVDPSGLLPTVSTTTFRVACDVDNPLYGPLGAAYVYAAQKGATPDQLIHLDAGLRQLATVTDGLSHMVAHEPGSGAAGGLGFGARVFLKATLTPGFALVADYLHLRERIAESDLVITGEGRLDEQTLSGKVIRGLTQLAEPLQVPVVAFCGTLALTATQSRQLGVHFAQSILTGPMDLSTAMQQAPELLTEASQRLAQFISRMPLSSGQKTDSSR
ncbi:MAG: glycerate kinase [Bacteroidetes bacterium]|nr:glycerate kinase [Fibrella sp.]